MSRTVTLGELKTRARQKADAVGDTVWVTDDELVGYLDAAYTELVDLLVTAQIHQFEAFEDFTTTVGEDTYDLPDDFYKLLAVDYKWSTSPERFVEVEQFVFAERNRYSILAVNDVASGFAAGHRVIGDTVKLYPPEIPAGQVYRIHYVPNPGTLVGQGDAEVIEGIAGWDEMLVVTAAIAMKKKEEADARDLEQDRDRIIARIAQMGCDRTPPQQIAAGKDDAWYWPDSPRSGGYRGGRW